MPCGNNTITDPGKFEGEALFAPHFWDLGLDGGADSDDGNEFVFNLTDDDRAEFPDLNEADILVMTEDENGFVYSKLYASDEWERIIALREMAEDSDDEV